MTRELRPADRFEWEGIILRARLSGLIAGNGRGTRGGVSAAAFKAVALAWASHADTDGGSIYPGDATLAVEAEVGLKVAQAAKRKLVELGLTERVKAGARRQHRGDEYRLTLPSDLLEMLDVLTPAAVKARAIAMYEAQRGKRGGSSGPPTTPPPAPVDNSNVQGPPDPPQPAEPETRGGSDGTDKPGCGGSDGTSVGGPLDRDTNQDQPPIDQPLRSQGSYGPHPYARDRPQNPESSPLPTKCPHGLRSRLRPDGTPTCTLCRRGLTTADPDHLADVIPLRRTA